MFRPFRSRPRYGWVFVAFCLFYLPSPGWSAPAYQTCAEDGGTAKCTDPVQAALVWRIADHRINRIHELLPWNVADQLNQPAEVADAMAA